jgi:hypothetical protein
MEGKPFEQREVLLRDIQSELRLAWESVEGAIGKERVGFAPGC